MSSRNREKMNFYHQWIVRVCGVEEELSKTEQKQLRDFNITNKIKQTAYKAEIVKILILFLNVMAARRFDQTRAVQTFS